MWATLSRDSLLLTRPMYSSMSLGLLPAASMRVAFSMSWGMGVSLLRMSGVGNMDLEGDPCALLRGAPAPANTGQHHEEQQRRLRRAARRQLGRGDGRRGALPVTPR